MKKRKIDIGMALSMIKEGKKIKEVAEYFGVTYQAIIRYRRKWITAGLLPSVLAKPHS